MKRIRSNTQHGRLLRVLSDGDWHGGPDEFGNDFHKAASRIGELAGLGFPTESRRREGKPWYEYRLCSAVSAALARHLVGFWDGRNDGKIRWMRPESGALAHDS